MAKSGRVIVDALSAQTGGGLTYIIQQLTALERVRPDLDLVVLASPRNASELSKALCAQIRVIRTPNLAVRLAFEQVVMPYLVRNGDVLYCPGNFCPLFARGRPILLTLQNPNHFGQGRSVSAWNPLKKWSEILLARASVRRADLVISVSKCLRDEAIADGLDGSKIIVILSGSPEWPEDEQAPEPLDEACDFVLSLANDYRAKRLDDLVDAWSLAFANIAHSAPQLVFAGHVSSDRVRDLLARADPSLQGKILHLGAVADRAVVKWLLRRARVMVSTSQLESFGLTLVEAGALGCPAIVSDIPAHREVAEGHVRFFNVGAVEELAAALRETVPRANSGHSWQWAQTWDRNAAQLGEALDSLRDAGRHGKKG